VFAAEGWGKCTGEVGVCIATSGPGATNLVTGLADALLDSVPMVAITGQVPRPMIGTDAFQETPIVEITRQITKHNYLVLNVEDLPRIVKEAFYLARTGRPGPVLIDVPKDIQQQLTVPDWDVTMAISGYMNRLPSAPVRQMLQPVIDAIHQSERPVAYIGGGCLDASDAVTEFLDRTGIPTVQTLMGLGTFPASRDTAHGMLGMHGTEAANCAVDEADLLLAIGVRFDDRVTGKLETFAARARIVHIDIDPAEIHKNKVAHVPVCADARAAVPLLNTLLDDAPVDPQKFASWRDYLDGHRQKFPMRYPQRDDVIIPQWAIQALWEETKGEAIITTGVGQHQMWAAQWYPLDRPRHWVSSGGLGSMGFGLPSALGAAAAYDGPHNPSLHVVTSLMLQILYRICILSVLWLSGIER
jgi:acetolactate synthase I/II/III large subunit